jgi:hypothetical protein
LDNTKVTPDTHIDDIDAEYNAWIAYYEDKIYDVDKVVWWIRVIVIILLKTFRDKWH